MVKAVLFDLDGTLVESAGEIIEAMNDVLRANGLNELDGDVIKDSVGLGTAWLTERCLLLSTGEKVNREDQLFETVYPQFLKRYAEIAGTSSTLFEGVYDTVNKLREKGIKIAVVTNKGRPLAERVLEGHSLSDKINVLVAGGDTKKSKPDAEPLFFALKSLGIDKSDAIFVGDSAHDVEAARAAKMSVWAMTYGYNHGEDVALSKPDLLFDSFSEVARELGL